YDEKQPAAAQNNFPPQQDLARHQRGYKTLGKMSYAIIVVAGQVVMVAYPVKERDFGVSVMPAHKQNAGVQEDQDVNKRRELEPGVGDCQGQHGKQRGKNLQDPGEIIVRADCRPAQHQSKCPQQQEENWFVFCHDSVIPLRGKTDCNKKASPKRGCLKHIVYRSSRSSSPRCTVTCPRSSPPGNLTE